MRNLNEEFASLKRDVAINRKISRAALGVAIVAAGMASRNNWLTDKGLAMLGLPDSGIYAGAFNLSNHLLDFVGKNQF